MLRIADINLNTMEGYVNYGIKPKNKKKYSFIKIVKDNV